ncbi:MAG: site-specific integrase [Moorella sp. (in: firmicutes)]
MVDWQNGKPKRVTYYGKTKKEVFDKLAKAKAELQQGTFVEPTRVTFGEWLQVWLEEYKKPAVRPSTWVSYEQTIRNHIQPSLGHILLQQLKPHQLQRLYNQKLAEGLSNRTVRLIHVVAHAALKQAVKNGLIARNVAEATSPPGVKKREIRVLTLEEQHRFLEAAKGERLYTAFLLALASGVRLGELLGLRWQDVNWERGGISVNQALQRVRGKPGEKSRLDFLPPKTSAGRRFIPLPEEAIKALKRWKVFQTEERLKAGPLYEDNGLVFTTEIGKPIDPRNLLRTFYCIVKRAGMEHFNFHALRHTFATRLLELGEHPKVVQELLGDSQITVVLDTYSHVLPTIKEQAAAKLNNILLRGRKNEKTS